MMPCVTWLDATIRDSMGYCKVDIKNRSPFDAFQCRKCNKAVTEAYEISTTKKTKGGEMILTEWECDKCHTKS